MTCADRDEARRIGRALVEARLAACVNLRPHDAIYRWEGRIETGEEWGLIAKTSAAALPALIERVRALHSYDCPCVAAWPITAGNAPYLDWVAGEVAAAPVP